MILSNKDIEDYLNRGIIKITPRPSEEQIGPASVDLTLSDDFWKPKRMGGKLDISRIGFNEVMEHFKAGEVELKPRQMVLGKTVEKIELPSKPTPTSLFNKPRESIFFPCASADI